MKILYLFLRMSCNTRHWCDFDKRSIKNTHFNRQFINQFEKFTSVITLLTFLWNNQIGMCALTFSGTEHRAISENQFHKNRNENKCDRVFTSQLHYTFIVILCLCMRPSRVGHRNLCLTLKIIITNSITITESKYLQQV